MYRIKRLIHSISIMQPLVKRSRETYQIARICFPYLLKRDSGPSTRRPTSLPSGPMGHIVETIEIIFIPSVASKRGHETKKHVLIGCQTWRVLPPNIWSLTAVKANCRAKANLFIRFWSARFAYISFFSNFRYISRPETAHLPPEINLNVLKFLPRIVCWAKRNQVGYILHGLY